MDKSKLEELAKEMNQAASHAQQHGGNLSWRYAREWAVRVDGLLAEKSEATSCRATGEGDWVMVPREPTEAMLHAFTDGAALHDSWRKGYAAMLAAAAPTPAEPLPTEELMRQVAEARAADAKRYAIDPDKAEPLRDAGEFGSFYVCPSCHGTGNVTARAHDDLIRAAALTPAEPINPTEIDSKLIEPLRDAEETGEWAILKLPSGWEQRIELCKDGHWRPALGALDRPLRDAGAVAEVYALDTGERRVVLAKHARDLPVGTKLFAHPALQQPTKVTEEMVGRFLAWRLPEDFHPDGGISFKQLAAPGWTHDTWPTGTNLLHAGQARAMLEHILGTAAIAAAKENGRA